MVLISSRPKRGSTNCSHSRLAPLTAAVSEAIWSKSRDAALESFRELPGLPKSKMALLIFADGVYQSDKYDSLSIEGPGVSPGLI